MHVQRVYHFPTRRSAGYNTYIIRISAFVVVWPPPPRQLSAPHLEHLAAPEKTIGRRPTANMMRKVTFELGRCVRETGQALDRLGLRVLGDNSYKEKCACREERRGEGRQMEGDG
jgi:hypothetical protein